MKIGDLVQFSKEGLTAISIGETFSYGLIIDFNCKGEGGKHFVHVLVGGEIHILLAVFLEVVYNKRRRRK